MTSRIRLLPERYAIRHHGKEVLLPPRAFSILAHVAAAKSMGISPHRIFDLEYQLDPSGGPLSGRHQIVVYRCLINRRIATLGLAIVSSKRGAGCVYELRRVE